MMYDGGEETAREEEEEETAARVATKKQEPHTEMWGKTKGPDMSSVCFSDVR